MKLIKELNIVAVKVSTYSLVQLLLITACPDSSVFLTRKCHCQLHGRFYGYWDDHSTMRDLLERFLCVEYVFSFLVWNYHYLYYFPSSLTYMNLKVSTHRDLIQENEETSRYGTLVKVVSGGGFFN